MEQIKAIGMNMTKKQTRWQTMEGSNRQKMEQTIEYVIEQSKEPTMEQTRWQTSEGTKRNTWSNRYTVANYGTNP
jgi:hypothetical protein